MSIKCQFLSFFTQFMTIDINETHCDIQRNIFNNANASFVVVSNFKLLLLQCNCESVKAVMFFIIYKWILTGVFKAYRNYSICVSHYSKYLSGCLCCSAINFSPVLINVSKVFILQTKLKFYFDIFTVHTKFLCTFITILTAVTYCCYYCCRICYILLLHICYIFVINIKKFLMNY